MFASVTQFFDTTQAGKTFAHRNNVVTRRNIEVKFVLRESGTEKKFILSREVLCNINKNEDCPEEFFNIGQDVIRELFNEHDFRNDGCLLVLKPEFSELVVEA